MMHGQTVGYVRVSSADQNEARQIEALGEVDKLFSDKASGKDVNRPQLAALIDWVREGDTVRAASLDRLARSTADLLDLMKTFDAKGVHVEFVNTPALNTNTAQGTFMLTVLAAVAEFERALIRERQAEGIALAKQRGVYERRRKLDPKQVAEARKRIEAGVPKAAVARELGVSRQTLYTALKEPTANQQ